MVDGCIILLRESCSFIDESTKKSFFDNSKHDLINLSALLDYFRFL
jgi:hypothetical protein